MKLPSFLSRFSRPTLIIAGIVIFAFLLGIVLTINEQMGEQIMDKGVAVPTQTVPYGQAGSEDECRQKGGVWQVWGLSETKFCQIPASDAGKSCIDGSECEYGLCKGNLDTGLGQCAEFEQEFGCYSVLEGGVVVEEICVD